MENNIMGSTQNKEVEITITKKIAVPDFTKTLQESLAIIQAAKQTTEICNKEIEIEENEKGEMIKQYCVAIFTPFIEGIDDDTRGKIFSSSLYKSYANTFKGHNFYVRIEYQKHSHFAIFFGIDRETIMFIGIPLKPTEEVQVRKYMGMKWMAEGWSDYKMLLKTALNERINNRVKAAKDEASQKTEIVEALKNFTL